ncbi:ATP-binding response regulator [Dictyobacter arantiisoli]|uniref:histidine kinase n=1 Tax=Dictyobacter arantiisoli TaxID=2014874 RepID=A0A5A5TBC2_9CHLR|nr:winged helix-turn-helix domain-containing protein [Dictyobacter arantiisoli]GCF08313.1 hypothetical protein KDI_18770 [Dictyobacter arantiisoli]
MSSSIEKKHSKTTGGLWIAENAAPVTPHPGRPTEPIPAGFTREYQVLAEMCASMSSGFMLLNQHGRVTYSNESALRLLRVDVRDRSAFQEFDVQEHLLALSTDPQHARADLEQLWQHQDQERSTDLSLIDAAANWLRVRSFPVHDEQGRSLGRGVLLDDITLERSAAASRTETLMMAAHEFKTPLAIIKGCATTLLGGSARWDPSMQREMLQMIDAQSDRLYDVLNTLLDVWRFDAGTQPLHLAQVQLSELILQLITRWQKQSPEHRFVLDLPDDVPTVTCDALRIEQTLNHLLNNAVKNSHAGQIVRTMLDFTAGELRVSVSDEGIGIASEHLERIFDRFYRIEQASKAHNEHEDAALSDEPGGSGLGLSAARATIEAHRGRIWAESAGPGKGATFFFTLPLNASRYAPIETLTALEEPETSSGVTGPLRKTRTSSLDQGRHVRVLLAENDARLARYIRANLEEQQYRVRVVTHGIQFLRQLDLEETDVILLSTQLADMSGAELLKRLREFSHAPVIMLCDACDEDERVQMFELGSDDLVVKPFGMRELLARVRALLRRQGPPAEQKQQPSIFTTGELTIDYAQHQVTVRGQAVQLSRTEYKLLSTLAQNVGLVVTHELLLEKVWGPEYNRDIDFIWVYISRLRRKIEANSRHPEYILTVPDVGYKLARHA